MSPDPSLPADYKSTVFLPSTAFPMKAGLPALEPKLLGRWQCIGLEARMRASGAGRPPFILHDGPPYANGHIHIGHALNKILKDVINRCRRMQGFDVNYVPGWDCHGLPIEWEIEKKYRKAGRNKDQVPVIEFRRECREFAQHWIDVQKAEFIRLGVDGDWDNPYTTMSFAAESRIVAELGRFLMDGSLYRGSRPVMWSVVEKTALAEAEVEYKDHTSTAIHVAFPVATPALPVLDGARVIIWTTTPWTIPGNRAIAFGDGIRYGVFRVTAAGDDSRVRADDRLVAAVPRAEAVREAARIDEWALMAEFDGADLAGTVCRHPLAGQGYDFPVPLLPGDFVDLETGSGFVHIAPGHGADDWELGLRHGVPVPETVDADGAFLETVPLFAGRRVLANDGRDGDANRSVIGALDAAGGLLATGRLVHSYPHSWRSKAPVIFRTTPQWFISMSATGLRDAALSAIDETRFYPPAGRNRLRGMVETRPDWCVSRQRAWGVPITVFVDRATGQPLRDPRVNERIVAAVAAEGADAWFTSPPSRFLAPDHDVEAFEPVTDILDVWFDSGTTHSFVLEDRDDLSWPADLYLEGSDQHRGWFQSSLLESCGTRGRAPYRAVLTHGFVLAEDSQKMSKSVGNVTAPQQVIDQSGADILRLWVVGSDYSQDLRIGPEILKQQADIYRRLRNTLRFILGSLAGFTPAERLEPAAMPELERWVLHRLWQLDGQLREACDDFDFHPFMAEFHTFCAMDLSAFYFDIRKDSLYCDAAGAPRRRAARTVLHELFRCITAWLAPFACFTAEEAWLAGGGANDGSVHLQPFPAIPTDWRDDALAERWTLIRRLRRCVTGAIEIERAAKRIGASLQAHAAVYADDVYRDALTGMDLAELFITSTAHLEPGPAPSEAFSMADVAGVAAVITPAAGTKCARCWQVLTEVGKDHRHPGLCLRCVGAVEPQPLEVF